MELRCPQCGALNRDDSLDFPLCHQCHEELVKCRQCRHFSLAAERPGCEHPTYRSQVNVTATSLPPCGHFAPRPEYLPPARPLSQMHRAILVLLAVALLAAVLTAASVLVSQVDGAPDSFDLVVDGPGPVAAGSDFCLSFLVHNQSNDQSEPIALVLPANLLDNFAITAVTPRPDKVVAQAGQRMLCYPALPGRGWLDVRLDVSGTRVGEYHLRPHLATQAGSLEAQAIINLTVR